MTSTMHETIDIDAALTKAEQELARGWSPYATELYRRFTRGGLPETTDEQHKRLNAIKAQLDAAEARHAKSLAIQATIAELALPQRTPTEAFDHVNTNLRTKEEILRYWRSFLRQGAHFLADDMASGLASLDVNHFEPRLFSEAAKGIRDRADEWERCFKNNTQFNNLLKDVLVEAELGRGALVGAVEGRIKIAQQCAGDLQAAHSWLTEGIGAEMRHWLPSGEEPGANAAEDIASRTTLLDKAIRIRQSASSLPPGVRYCLGEVDETRWVGLSNALRDRIATFSRRWIEDYVMSSRQTQQHLDDGRLNEAEREIERFEDVRLQLSRLIDGCYEGFALNPREETIWTGFGPIQTLMATWLTVLEELRRNLARLKEKRSREQASEEALQTAKGLLERGDLENAGTRLRSLAGDFDSGTPSEVLRLDLLKRLERAKSIVVERSVAAEKGDIGVEIDALKRLLGDDMLPGWTALRNDLRDALERQRKAIREADDQQQIVRFLDAGELTMAKQVLDRHSGVTTGMTRLKEEYQALFDQKRNIEQRYEAAQRALLEGHIREPLARLTNLKTEVDNSRLKATELASSVARLYGAASRIGSAYEEIAQVLGARPPDLPRVGILIDVLRSRELRPLASSTGAVLSIAHASDLGTMERKYRKAQGFDSIKNLVTPLLASADIDDAVLAFEHLGSLRGDAQFLDRENAIWVEEQRFLLQARLQDHIHRGLHSDELRLAESARRILRVLVTPEDPRIEDQQRLECHIGLLKARAILAGAEDRTTDELRNAAGGGISDCDDKDREVNELRRQLLFQADLRDGISRAEARDWPGALKYLASAANCGPLGPQAAATLKTAAREVALMDLESTILEFEPERALHSLGEELFIGVSDERLGKLKSAVNLLFRANTLMSESERESIDVGTLTHVANEAGKCVNDALILLGRPALNPGGAQRIRDAFDNFAKAAERLGSNALLQPSPTEQPNVWLASKAFSLVERFASDEARRSMARDNRERIDRIAASRVAKLKRELAAAVVDPDISPAEAARLHAEWRAIPSEERGDRLQEASKWLTSREAQAHQRDKQLRVAELSLRQGRARDALDELSALNNIVGDNLFAGAARAKELRVDIQNRLAAEAEALKTRQLWEKTWSDLRRRPPTERYATFDDLATLCAEALAGALQRNESARRADPKGEFGANALPADSLLDPARDKIESWSLALAHAKDQFREAQTLLLLAKRALTAGQDKYEGARDNEDDLESIRYLDQALGSAQEADGKLRQCIESLSTAVAEGLTSWKELTGAATEAQRSLQKARLIDTSAELKSRAEARLRSIEPLQKVVDELLARESHSLEELEEAATQAREISDLRPNDSKAKAFADVAVKERERHKLMAAELGQSRQRVVLIVALIIIVVVMLLLLTPQGKSLLGM